ncbi:MAG: hypothetical protein ABL931_01730 [Usitatibacteraceae bacterium]
MNSLRPTDIDRRTLLVAAAVVLLPKAPLMAATNRSPAARDFDFLLGRWTVKHRKLKKRLQQNDEWFEFAGSLDVKSIIGGNGNVDENILRDPGGQYLATSLRVFDEKLSQWSVYWIDERYPGIDKPVVGRFEDGIGKFYGDENLAGQPIKVRFTYQSLDVRNARWTQAFSSDEGNSWETNWVMDFSRGEPPQ